MPRITLPKVFPFLKEFALPNSIQRESLKSMSFDNRTYPPLIHGLAAAFLTQPLAASAYSLGGIYSQSLGLSFSFDKSIFVLGLR